MDTTALEAETISFIAETLGIPEETISLESEINDLSEDSIKLFELLLAFEKKYQTKTTYEDVVKLHTVGDIVAYLQEHHLGSV